MLDTEKNAETTSRNDEEVMARRRKESFFFYNVCAVDKEFVKGYVCVRIRCHLTREKSRACERVSIRATNTFFAQTFQNTHARPVRLVCPNRSSITQERDASTLESSVLSTSLVHVSPHVPSHILSFFIIIIFLYKFLNVA